MDLEKYKIVHPKRAAFLAAYAEIGVVSRAADAAGVRRPSHYDWLKEDPEYVGLFEQAHREACDSMEREARRRAIEGDEIPVFQKGEQVGTIQKKSDILLMFLMKGAMPDKYRENLKVEADVKQKTETTHRWANPVDDRRRAADTMRRARADRLAAEEVQREASRNGNANNGNGVH